MPVANAYSMSERQDASSDPRPYRYERKFLVDQLGAKQIQVMIKLHPAMFFQPYPPRYINNLYMDTIDMSNYYDNVNGAMRRTKVRIRWYGELFAAITRPVLEFKIKDGFVGRKVNYPLGKFHLGVGFRQRDLQDLLAESQLPEEVAFLLREQAVVLCNRYYRWYYVSRDGRYRLTLDDELEFHRLSQGRNTFAHHQVNRHERIVELKYGLEDDFGADMISSYFPFRVTKSSKYVQGIERVYF